MRLLLLTTLPQARQALHDGPKRSQWYTAARQQDSRQHCLSAQLLVQQPCRNNMSLSNQSGHIRVTRRDQQLLVSLHEHVSFRGHFKAEQTNQIREFRFVQRVQS